MIHKNALVVLVVTVIIAFSFLLANIILYVFIGIPRDIWESHDQKYRLIFFETISLPRLTFPGHGGGFKYHGYFKLVRCNGEALGKVFVNERIPERMEPYWLEDRIVFLNCQGILYGKHSVNGAAKAQGMPPPEKK